jgi:hypothetical protein
MKNYIYYFFMSEKPVKTMFETLSLVDIAKGVEKRKTGSSELSYLSWSFAWGELKRTYPTANYKVKEFDGKPYLFDENLGYMVSTTVTIDGESVEMHLPVMDGTNKAQKHVAYTYKTKAGDRKVEPATMFDINTAIMRCLVKNIAMFGLGLSLYYGEDLPAIKEIKAEEQKTEQIAKTSEILISKLEKKEIKDLGQSMTWVEANKAHINSEKLDILTNLISSYNV